MIEHAQGLTDSALEAIAGLERRVVAADGGRLKLEWGSLRQRPSGEVRDLLSWEGERLVGFLGIYGHSWDHLEVTGMVDPDARRRGIGRALFDAALPLCRAQEKQRLLLVVPRTSPGGEHFARGYGMTFDHAEHALRLTVRPDGPATCSPVDLRVSTARDVPVLREMYAEAFGDAPSNLEQLVAGDSGPLMIEHDGQTAGTIAAVREGERGAIYGFIVVPRLRGRGIGREALRSACQHLFDTGMSHVDLEVEVENDNALGLYTTTGFELRATDDYYELMLD